MHGRICRWLVVAFESSTIDPSEYIRTEYDGTELHIKPSHDEYCNRVSVFLRPETTDQEALTKINRFFSAMAWKDGEMFITRGYISGGARESDKNNPRFNYGERRRHPYGVGSRFDFEHLQVVRKPEQLLALALYREGLNSDQGFYKFLSFYKVINILRSQVAQQADWINGSLGRVWNPGALERLKVLENRGLDIGNYLASEGRCAIAHSYEEPVRDPDLPEDLYEVHLDTRLIRGLAEVAIERELGVPSMRKIWHEHLYELEGFRELLGRGLTVRLEEGQSVPASEFPALPKISIRLRGYEPFPGLEALQAELVSVRNGVVVLGVRPPCSCVHLLLALDFPRRTLELLQHELRIDRGHATYCMNTEVGLLRFLKGLIGNGYLEIYDTGTNKRLSHKLAYLPRNIDLRRTLEGLQTRIDELIARSAAS